MSTARILEGDCLDVLATLPERSVQTCITSPPFYGLRDYGTATWTGGDPECDHKKPGATKTFGNPAFNENRPSREATDTVGYRDTCGKCGATRTDSQIGLEETPEQYVANLVAVFDQVWRVLRDDGCVFLNLGDSYASANSAPTPARQPLSARACGSDDTAPRDSRATDSACPDLCDGCRAATQDHHGRSADTGRRHGLDEPPPSPISRGIALPGSERASLDASPLDAQASTIQRSSEPPQDECSHCANCGACLAVLRSSSRDARACARTAEHRSGNDSLALESRSPGTGASGTAWFNYKPKDLLGIPWRVAFALQARGWFLRSDIIWSKKPNPMPESVTDRPTKAHEYLFLLTKSSRYFYDSDAIREDFADERMGNPGQYVNGYSDGAGRNDAATKAQAWTKGAEQGGRNKRSVWTVATQPFPGAHFATFPPKLIEPCVLAGSSPQACAECGAPWERTIEKGDLVPVRGNLLPGDISGGKEGSARAQYNGDKTMVRTDEGWSLLKRETRTTGWQPTCDHSDGSARCTVLDPFSGAGTTGVVALRHDRDYIGIELNPTYAQMARDRIYDDGPLLNLILGDAA